MPVGGNISVQIDGTHGEKSRRGILKSIDFDADAEKGQVKTISVVTDDIFETAAEDQEREKDIFFLQPGVIKPLCELPFVLLSADTSDQIDPAVRASDPRSGDVQKQDITGFEFRVGKRDVGLTVNGFADDPHWNLLHGNKGRIIFILHRAIPERESYNDLK
jgi:hypothetical protein